MKLRTAVMLLLTPMAVDAAVGGGETRGFSLFLVTGGGCENSCEK